MCDTIIALPSATAAGGVLFGKNSDRERNEAQAVEFFPAQHHAPDSTLACTHIQIPQAEETHAVLLCRPFWLWGAEMGANEHNVVIGNEAVHPRFITPRDPGLIGMDLLRLGLERGATAAQAVDVIIALLEQFGQGGNCGHLSERFYNNSFIVADAREAFVLETAGHDWVVQRAAGVRSISNAYSIDRAYDRISAGLKDKLEGQPVSALTNLNLDSASQGRKRCERSTTLLRRQQGQIGAAEIGAAEIKAILRDHGTGDDRHWSPSDAIRRTICMHAAEAKRGGQTVNSMVSELTGSRAMHWVTGTAAPCLSIFKPVPPGRAVTPHGPRPSDRYDANTLWWCHERMHRAMLTRFPHYLATLRAERDALERSFRLRIRDAMDNGTKADVAAMADTCWAEAGATERRWADAAGTFPTGTFPAGTFPAGKSPFDTAWREMSALAAVV